jgi:hypothetical protein
MPKFTDTKEAYKKARAEERKKLKIHFDSFTKTKGHFLHGYTPIFGRNSGMGKSDYTNNSTLTSKYDLSNWKWLTFVKFEDNYKKCLTIYFQSPNYDERTKNRHTFDDRLSFDFSLLKKVGDPDKYEKVYQSDMFITDIDLPLTESSMNKLLSIIDININKVPKFKNLE